MWIHLVGVLFLTNKSIISASFCKGARHPSQVAMNNTIRNWGAILMRGHKLPILPGAKGSNFKWEVVALPCLAASTGHQGWDHYHGTGGCHSANLTMWQAGDTVGWVNSEGYMQSVLASRDGGLVWKREQDQIIYTSVSIKIDNVCSHFPSHFQSTYFNQSS